MRSASSRSKARGRKSDHTSIPPATLQFPQILIQPHRHAKPCLPIHLRSPLPTSPRPLSTRELRAQGLIGRIDPQLEIEDGFGGVDEAESGSVWGGVGGEGHVEFHDLGGMSFTAQIGCLTEIRNKGTEGRNVRTMEGRRRVDEERRGEEEGRGRGRRDRWKWKEGGGGRRKKRTRKERRRKSPPRPGLTRESSPMGS